MKPMKYSLLFALLSALLALSACQNEKTPQAKAPAEPVATQSQAASLQSDTLPVKNAVAVTKPEPADTANSIRTAMKQAEVAQAVQSVPVQHSADTGALEKAARETVKKAAPGAVKKAVPKTVLKTIPKTAPKAKRATEKPAKAIRTVVKKAVKTAPLAPVMTKPAVTTAPAAAAVLGDAARGKNIARKCQACHNFTAKKKVGPGLKGIFGRKAGIMPDMRYSKALKAGGWVWNEKHLHMWDCNSRKAIKVLTGNPSAKTKMPPQHICDATKLADLTAFLKTL